MAKHYSVNGDTIIADITKLTDKELAEVQRYQALGFKVVSGKVEPAKTVKRLDDPFITKYLEDDMEGLAKYNALIDENVLNEDGSIKYHLVIDKKKSTKDNKVMKQGKPFKKGFNAGRNWFASNYPKDVSVAIKAIADAGFAKSFDKAWKAYEKKEPEEGKAKQTKDEYTRDYYWKKVFEQK